MSLFKRLFGEKDDVSNNPSQVFKLHINNSNIKAMGSNLQKRFSRGVQYNMKIVIRGDRNVGKSALLARLKGLEFCDQYIPTDEIEVACIHWNYKATDDVVKVEVWDVVDKGRRKKHSGLKLDNNASIEENAKNMCLDAEFLDVYKGAHAVIMVLDITKSWTLNYVERELQLVPEHLPVLVLANHRDMGHHRTVNTDQVQALVESVPSFKKGLIKCWESSMKNGYGLIYIHRFFNIPFLQLQRDTLLKLLVTNEKDIETAFQELTSLEEEPESIYDNFIANLKHMKNSNSQSQKPSSLSLHSNPVSQINSPTTTPVPVPPKVSLTPLNDIVYGVPERAVIHPPQARPIPGMDKLGLFPLPVPGDNKSSVANPVSSNHSKDKRNIDEFVPEEQPELSSFLDDLSSGKSPNQKLHPEIMESSSDENEFCDTTTGGKSSNTRQQNPMVTAFQDDIDIEDLPVVLDNVKADYYPSFNNESLSSEDDNGDFGAHRRYPIPVVVPAANVPGHQKIANITQKVSSIGLETFPGNYQNGYNSNTLPVSINKPSYDKHDVTDRVSSKLYPNTSAMLNNDSFPVHELDTDEATVNSSNSAKKKKKKHHKDSNKESSSKRKKKSKSKSQDMSQTEVAGSSSPPSQGARKSSKVPRKSRDDVIEHDVIPAFDQSMEFVADRSDSLERFLND